MSNPRVHLFGATGYTGRLVAGSMVRRGLQPTLVGRDRLRLEALAHELDLSNIVVADSRQPEVLVELLEAGEVLTTTVGPFLELGDAALNAALRKGAHYLDVSGEGGFVSEVFRHSGRAEGRCALLPSIGFTSVSGCVAGALAIEQAKRRPGEQLARLEIAYAAHVPAGGPGMSSGTSDSILLNAGAPSITFAGGRIQNECAASRVARFHFLLGAKEAVSVGGLEQFELPPLAPSLREVDVYFAGLGGLSKIAQISSRISSSIPGAFPRIAALDKTLQSLWRGPKCARAGPTAAARQASRSETLAIAKSAAGKTLAEVRMPGPSTYEITADLMAWVAGELARGNFRSTGALGPLSAFGLEATLEACRAAGMTVA